MTERKDVVKIKGNPVTLVGKVVKVGDSAPDFSVLNETLQPVRLSEFSGKTVVISAVTSLDTATCDVETRKFNEEVGNMGDDVVVLTISMDLPFAQKRWCAAAGVENVKVLSDYRDADFGENYGVLIKELRLLARTIFIVNKEGKVEYVQHVAENSEEPDYDEVLNALKQKVTR